MLRRNVPGTNPSNQASRSLSFPAPMKPLTLIAILLIVIAILAFAYEGISYTTTEQLVTTDGPAVTAVTAVKTHTIPTLPAVGSVAIVGITLLLGRGVSEKWPRSWRRPTRR